MCFVLYKQQRPLPLHSLKINLFIMFSTNIQIPLKVDNEDFFILFILFLFLNLRIFDPKVSIAKMHLSEIPFYFFIHRQLHKCVELKS